MSTTATETETTTKKPRPGLDAETIRRAWLRGRILDYCEHDEGRRVDIRVILRRNPSNEERLSFLAALDELVAAELVLIERSPIAGDRVRMA